MVSSEMFDTDSIKCSLILPFQIDFVDDTLFSPYFQRTQVTMPKDVLRVVHVLVWHWISAGVPSFEWVGWNSGMSLKYSAFSVSGTDCPGSQRWKEWDAANCHWEGCTRDLLLGNLNCYCLNLPYWALSRVFFLILQSTICPLCSACQCGKHNWLDP